MINYLWEGMIIIGVIFGIISGNADKLGTGVLDSATEAIQLVIGMTGIIAMWSGFMEVAEGCGIVRKLNRLLSGPVAYLYPDVEKDSKAAEYISINMVANMLGLGWAATPSGLMAMQELKKIHEADCDRKLKELKRKGREPDAGQRKHFSPDCASTSMCTFLIINISSLQLIPVNIIAYRSRYGSVNPAAFVGAGLAATIFSTLVGILFARIMSMIAEKKDGVQP